MDLKILAWVLGLVCIGQLVAVLYLMEIIDRKIAALDWVRVYGALFPAQLDKLDDLENGIYD